MRIHVLAILGTLAIGVSGLSAQSSKTISGFVSDSQCGATHSSASDSATKCVKGCLKHGGEPVVVSEGKVYHLKGKTDAVREFAGLLRTLRAGLQHAGDGDVGRDVAECEGLRVSGFDSGRCSFRYGLQSARDGTDTTGEGAGQAGCAWCQNVHRTSGAAV